MNTIIPRMNFDEVIDGFFNKSLSDIIGADYTNTQPSLNIIEAEDHFALELAAPGMEKGDFDVSLENGILKVSAEKKLEQETEEGNFRRREFNYSAFERSMRVPKSVDQEAITATYENGILNIKLTKKEIELRNSGKTIEIK